MSEGFTFQRPSGALDHRVFATVEAAQTEAAFETADISSVVLPRDWDTAYKRGYRILPAKIIVTGSGKRKWKVYDG